MNLLPVTTVDALVKELALSSVDFVKMDIDGSEVEALRGAKRTIARHRPQMSICVYHKSGDLAEVPRAVAHTRGDYRTENRCALLWDYSLRPDITYFR